MTSVRFDDQAVEGEQEPRIEYALTRIAWREPPDGIVVHRRLTGGRSASQVLEVTLRRGNQQSRKVVKVGPLRELQREYEAFDLLLRDAAAVFAPIEAGTPEVVDLEDAGRAKSPEPESSEPQALVYDHASRFTGTPKVSPQTLEERAREAIQAGGAALSTITDAVTALFEAARNDLYDKSHPRTTQQGGLATALNHRLGPALEIEVDRGAPKGKPARLTLGQLPPSDLKKFQRRFPREVFEASTRLDATIKAGDRIRLSGLQVDWWDERLIATLDERLQVAVVSNDPPIASVIGKLEQGNQFEVYGKVRSTRADAHHRRLSAGDLQADGEVLRGDRVSVPDPFASLHRLLGDDPSESVWSVVHGDLNPRNILLIGDNPCLIDYAFTARGEPILADFTRLEGSLARDALPTGWDWAQHVRLQRLLAAACRLGDDAADRFARLLTAEEPSMGSAFRLLWSIRRAARAVYPTQAQQPWWREYLVQLFLFAHLALKWPDPSSVTLHATAAMVGVAAEVLDEQGIYRFWSSEELGATAVEILGSLEHDPANALAELAQLVGELDRRRLPRDDRDRLDEAVERVRAAFVREYFEDAALGTLHRLKLDHDVYISLLAYIGLTGHLHEPGSRDPKARRPHQEPPEGDGSPEGRDGAGLGPGDADLTLLLEEAEAARTEQGDSRDVLELLTELREVVILGDAGAGKSTVARELEYRLAEAVVTEEPGQLLPRMPVIVRASRIADQLDDPATGKPRPCADVLLGAIGGTWPTDLLTVGALHVTVDALNELGDPHKDRVAEWLTELRRRFPRTPVAACHRLYLYEPGLLPFRTVTLDKVAPEQAEGYIHDYLRENQVPDHEAMARRLVHLLLDPEHEQVRDLAQTPLFLWMIVSRYRETGVRPSNRGQLFHDFSRWYMEERHHSEQDELAAWEFGYEQKSELLEAVAAALVDRGSTEIAEEEVVPPLVPESLGPRWREVLEATVRSEMVRRSDGQLRFLHQSFQEYFAARHFLRTAANDPGVVRSRVHSHRWHDTSTILLGFAGERPDVVTRVLQTALEVNPTLTARCLRVAERPEPELLDRFVKEQEATLRNPRAGDHAQERAATALAEYGRGPARDVLVKLATDPSAHLASRAKAINRLAGMVGQARSETRQRDLRDDLTKALVRLFEEVAPSQDPASTEVLRAAIDAAARARLTALALVVADLVNDSMPWSLADAAYQALPALGIVPPAKLQARYRRLCQARLPEIERELLAASINDQFEKLQEERVAILGQLVDPANLERLLRRRFALGIANRVGPLLERAVELPGDVPAAARRAWEVLREPAAAGPPPLGRWLRLLADADDLTAVAAAHRIQATGEGGDGARLAALLRPDQSPTKLCALAGLLQQDGDVRLLERAEGLVQTLMTTIEGPEATEAVACLVQAIRALDTKRGHRLAAVVDYMFWTRVEATQPDRFPWLAVWTGTWLESKDIEVLLQGDANQVAAAVQFLYNTAGWGLLRANYPVPTRRLDPQAMERLTVAAHGEREPARQRIIACAAAGVDAFDLLPWLLELVEAPELSAWNHDVDSHYGDVEESCRAMVLRATGYLARRANQPHGSIAERAELTLRHFSEAEDRSTVVGAVTGLAYLGDWKAVLRTLGPGEPWLREVAQNVFRRWVPFADLKGATRWIACRLRDDPDLHPDVRSSLELIKDENERQLGHHVTCDE